MLPFGRICQAESAAGTRGSVHTHTHPHTITGGPAKGFGDHYVRHHPEKSNQFEASLLGGEKKGKSGRWWCKFIVGDCC